MRILIADDNEPNRILAVSILEREGHIVVAVKNGKKALLECEGVKFDLILMDILMPIMDGIKTLRTLRRSNNRNANTPVFAFTAYSSASDRRMYRQCGFEFFLPKPLRQKDLEKAWDAYTNPNINENLERAELRLQNTNAVVDFKHWAEIKATDTDNQLSNIVRKFWENASICLKIITENTELASQSTPSNLNLLRKAAHNLKESSSSLALRRLEYLSAKLQNAPPEEIPIIASELKKCSEESRQTQLSYLDTHIPKRGFSGDRSVDGGGRTISIQIQP